MRRFRNILYHADGPDSSARGLDRAVALARTNQARLTVLDVTEPVSLGWDPQGRYGPKLTEALVRRRLDELEAITERYADAGIALYTRVLTGMPFIEVIGAVQRESYDLLVKTARPGLGPTGLASADMHLLRKCPCPVWVDRPDSPYPYRTLLAAVDPTHRHAAGLNRLILDLATSLAAREGARLEVVHAWSWSGYGILCSEDIGLTQPEVDTLRRQSERGYRTALDRLLAPYGLSSADPGVHLEAGWAPAVIAKRAEETGADLILMGTVSRVGVRGLIMGPTAEDLLRATRGSVLAVKPEGFASPVLLP